VLIGRKSGKGQLPEALLIANLHRMYSETRPWGAFHVLDEKPGFKVKRLSVHEGGRLSLQSHKHRAEHWTVVSGTATVTINSEVFTLTRGAACDIPLGAKHRLENLHKGEVEIIEVQFGHYLGEDDIIRYDDAYNRS
jgi:mannose-6-phosphate isomerase